MTEQDCAFQLLYAETVTGDVDDIVDSTYHPEVSVFIAVSGVVGEVVSGHAGKVFPQVALRLFPQCAERHGKRAFKNEVSRHIYRDGIAIVVDDIQFRAEELRSTGAGFHGGEPSRSGKRSS